ncbi:YndJ family transporter [Candidatus Uabimicrobium amorphum]|uniref:Putative membrane protein YndJ n=1 Tax=Uabimicrobium amorphum TaxID=2596890 RepID=A0A5S9IJ90_UABAM|nr:YndJ family transporter [Candidatus Uabimicrobium amorphum]BBM82853.1 putative membrane protein YndJ [Candidatus Uabimicrobium amorphum]
MTNTFSFSINKVWLYQALLGMAAFITVCVLQPFVFLPSLGGIGYTISFAPLVIVPIALSLITIDQKHILQRIAMIFHFPAAICAVVSMCVNTGSTSAMLALPWLMQNLIIAVYGIVFFLTVCDREKPLFQQLPGVSVLMGCLYIPIAGVWLVSSNMGITFGFRSTIVLLTAAHFHYAGFALSVLAGLGGFAVDKNKRFVHKLYYTTGWVVVFCPVFVAMGIIFSPLLEMVAACTLAVAIIIFSATTAFGFSCRTWLSKIFFITAFLAMIATMALAATYAMSEYYDWHVISISTMAITHGVANAFGFTFLSLCAWLIEIKNKRSNNQ